MLHDKTDKSLACLQVLTVMRLRPTLQLPNVGQNTRQAQCGLRHKGATRDGRRASRRSAAGSCGVDCFSNPSLKHLLRRLALHANGSCVRCPFRSLDIPCPSNFGKCTVSQRLDSRLLTHQHRLLCSPTWSWGSMWPALVMTTCQQSEGVTPLL